MNRYIPLLRALFLALVLSAGLSAQKSVGSEGSQGYTATHPVFHPGGTTLYFTRPNHPGNKGTDNAADVWVRQRNADGSWGRVINPGSPVNSFRPDRVVGISPDGNRLAVWRGGLRPDLDILETTGRSWRVTASWPLPADATAGDLVFDLNANELLYARAGDLYARRLTAAGWSAAAPRVAANGPAAEGRPVLAADGRTLYFRRDANRWYRQDNPGQRPRAVAIPSSANYLAIAPNDEQIIIGDDGRLLVLTPAAQDLPPAARLVRGYLPEPLPADQETAGFSLEDGTLLAVRPDALGRYTLFLRNGERLLTGPAPAGGAAASAGALSPTDLATDLYRLREGIASRQADLERLAAERRKYELVAPSREDTELTALQNSYARLQGNSFADTVPPARDDRYAAELSELERMKAKFRRQQDDRLNRRSGGGNDWSAPTTTTTAKGGSPSATNRLPTSAAQHHQDSLRYASGVAAGLRADKSPRVYEREAWENEVRQGLPHQEPLSPEEVARLDVEYQRQLAELETLRAKLRQMEGYGTPPAEQSAPPRSTAPARDWSARSPVATTPAVYPSNTAPRYAPATPSSAPAPPPPSQSAAPPTYGRSAAAPPTAPTGVAMPAGISFIPNTAYPDSRGYRGLDGLIALVSQSSTAVEVRVHTRLDQSPRAAQLLSEERATTIRNHLLKAGLPAESFRVIGFGNNLTGAEGPRVEVIR